MIDIVKICEGKEEAIYVCNMAIGDIGILSDEREEACCNGHVVLRTYERVVDLTNPNHSWIPSTIGGLTVRLYPHGTEITIRVLSGK